MGSGTGTVPGTVPAEKGKKTPLASGSGEGSSVLSADELAEDGFGSFFVKDRCVL